MTDGVYRVSSMRNEANQTKKRACIVKLGYYELRLLKRSAETLAADGYQVDVICLRKKGELAREALGGVKVYRLPGEHHRQGIFRYFFEYSYYFILVSLVLSWLSLKKKYDVIEICSMPDFLVFAAIVPRLQRSKVILYLWENMAQLFTSTFNAQSNHPGVKLLQLIERMSAGWAHHIIVADGILYKRVLESHGVPGGKITVIQNVPDNTIFNLESLPSAKNGQHFHVIVAASHIKRYGVQVLIKAMPLLIRDMPELRVDVTGDGEFRPELEKLCCNLGVQEWINFTGFISYEDFLSYIAQAQVGVAPMLYDVGMSNKVFEYFALGTPCVASALPSLIATFNDDCILYYPPGNEKALAARILELYLHPEKRASMVRYGYEFYRKCQWQVMKQEYLRIYEELLESKNGRRKNGKRRE
ncbi:MAG: glycosyltransferase family 4 protein [Dehalococcoidales bacterium]